MVANWRGRVVADSPETRQAAGYVYFPREAVRMDLLVPVERTAADLGCPHGVQFFDLVDGDQRSERAAWSYEAPLASLREVGHWIGFWRDVELA
jgi:uncharacterized protein (DUF427 family)